MSEQTNHVDALANHLKEKVRKTGWYSKLNYFFNSDDLIEIFNKLLIESNRSGKITPKMALVFDPLIRTNYDDLKVVIVNDYPLPFLNKSDGVPFSSTFKSATTTQIFFEYFFPEIKSLVKEDLENALILAHKKLTDQGFLFINFSVTTTVNKGSLRHHSIWKNYMEMLLDVINFHKNDVLIVSLSDHINEAVKASTSRQHFIGIENPRRALFMKSEWRTEGLLEKIQLHFPEVNLSLNTDPL